ncbi:MAG: acyl-CoA thioesterase [Limisphaerales bacterium]
MHPVGPPALDPSNPVPTVPGHTLRFRVRYSETDQMGTFYNSRPLEWFECGRTELLRHLGLPYATLESRGLFLPVVEAHLELLGRARYDDLLEMRTHLSLAGRARVRCDNRVVQADGGRDVARGWTIHVFAARDGRVTRPPAWFLETLEQAQTASEAGAPTPKA